MERDTVIKSRHGYLLVCTSDQSWRPTVGKTEENKVDEKAMEWNIFSELNRVSLLYEIYSLSYTLLILLPKIHKWMCRTIKMKLI